MKLSRRNMQTVSFMLFSLFFGAGNLILRRVFFIQTTKRKRT